MRVAMALAGLSLMSRWIGTCRFHRECGKSIGGIEVRSTGSDTARSRDAITAGAKSVDFRLAARWRTAAMEAGGAAAAMPSVCCM